jgi:hypothetical protein
MRVSLPNDVPHPLRLVLRVDRDSSAPRSGRRVRGLLWPFASPTLVRRRPDGTLAITPMEDPR